MSDINTLQSLFHQALALSDRQQREDFLDEACGGDDALRAITARLDGVELESFEVDEAEFAALGRHVLDAMHVHPMSELSIQLVGTEVMTDLHVRYLDEPGPTDVMSFVDAHDFPVDLVLRVLGIPASTYYD